MIRCRTLVALATAFMVAAAGCEQPAVPRLAASPVAPIAPTPSTSSAPSPSVTRPAPPATQPDTWLSWAWLNTADGTMMTGGQPGASTTESMIKVGIAADYLHGVEQARRDPNLTETALLTAMLRDSDDAAAETLWRARGGDTVLARLVHTCALRNTTGRPGWWADTEVNAGDAARLGACVADGRVCSSAWAEWILEQMRTVRLADRWGIVTAHPTDRGRPLAVKNGWTLRSDGTWHIACLAVTYWWSLAVLIRYPARLGVSYGADLCAQVAAAVLPPDS